MQSKDLRYLLNTEKDVLYNQELLIPVYDDHMKYFEEMIGSSKYQFTLERKKGVQILSLKNDILRACYDLMLLGHYNDDIREKLIRNGFKSRQNTKNEREQLKNAIKHNIKRIERLENSMESDEKGTTYEEFIGGIEQMLESVGSISIYKISLAQLADYHKRATQRQKYLEELKEKRHGR